MLSKIHYIFGITNTNCVSKSNSIFNILLTTLGSLLLISLLFSGSGQVSASSSLASASASKSKSSSIHFTSSSALLPLPESQNGEPIQILLDVSVLDIEEVDSLKMEMSVHFVLHQYWKDNRVHVDPTSTFYNETIWIPDTIISNKRSDYFIQEQQIIVYDKSTTEIIKSEKISAILKCSDMDFHLYPFDHQTCFINFESFAYSLDKLQLKWKHNNKEVDHNLGSDSKYLRVLPFKLLKLSKLETNVTSLYSSGTSSNKEEVSQLSIGIEFRRYWSIYTQKYYIPMTVFVGTSLLSLWLVHPKISFMVNFANLIVINIFLAVWEISTDIPKVCYRTAMDAYTNICQIFIVLILLLNVYILYYLKHEEDNNYDGSNSNSGVTPVNYRGSGHRRGSHELRYFLPKRDSSVNDPHPFLKTIHGKSGINCEEGQAAQGNVATSNKTDDDIDVMEYPLRRKQSVRKSNWNLIKAKLLDKIRRIGHNLFLCTFLATFLLYWITLLAIHYTI